MSAALMLLVKTQSGRIRVPAKVDLKATDSCAPMLMSAPLEAPTTAPPMRSASTFTARSSANARTALAAMASPARTSTSVTTTRATRTLPVSTQWAALPAPVTTATMATA